MADLFNYVQGKPFYSLSGNGINAAATQVTVSDFTLPDGTNITMSMFGDTGYGTFEPGTDKEENFSFTGVTQNGNGTATLTGLTRGLRFVSPYTADSGLAQGHGGNTPMVLSNSAPFYNELSGKDNDETITGTWTFTAPNYPQIDDPDNPPTQDEQFVTKKLLDDTAFAGANLNKIVVDAIAGETIAENDIVYFDESDNEWRLAAATFVDQTNYLVGLAMGAGTNGNAIDGGVMLEGIKTGFSGFTQGDIQYLSDTGGEISTSPGTIFFELGYAQSATQLYFTPKFKSYLTKNQKDALAGTSGTPSSSNKYVTDDDTDNAATANKIARYDSNGDMIVPTTPTDADAATSKTYVDTEASKLNTLNVTEATSAGTTSWLTVKTITLAANTLTDSNGIRVHFAGSATASAGNPQLRVQLDGTTLVTSQTFGNTENGQITFDIIIVADGATSAQKYSATANANNASGTVKSNTEVGTLSKDATSSLDFTFQVDSNDSDAVTGTFEFCTIEVIS